MGSDRGKRGLTAQPTRHDTQELGGGGERAPATVGKNQPIKNAVDGSSRLGTGRGVCVCGAWVSQCWDRGFVCVLCVTRSCRGEDMVFVGRRETREKGGRAKQTRRRM